MRNKQINTWALFMVDISCYSDALLPSPHTGLGNTPYCLVILCTGPIPAQQELYLFTSTLGLRSSLCPAFPSFIRFIWGVATSPQSPSSSSPRDPQPVGFILQPIWVRESPQTILIVGGEASLHFSQWYPSSSITRHRTQASNCP